MSTISQTPKMSTARNLNISNVKLFIIAALLVTFIAIFNTVAGSPAAKPTDHSAYISYRRGEWASVSIPVVDLSAYRLSERTMIDPNAGLTMFHLSERTLTDPQAGLEAYFNSERTMIPAPFTKFLLGH